MTYETLALIHLGTIFPAFVIATALLLGRKGSAGHRLWGKVYMALMLFSSAVSLLMSAQVGPALFGHFGFIHVLSFFAIYSVIEAWRAAKARNIRRHRAAMVGLYCGGLLIAGGFALMPGRLLHTWLFA